MLKSPERLDFLSRSGAVGLISGSMVLRRDENELGGPGQRKRDDENVQDTKVRVLSTKYGQSIATMLSPCYL
jgi:hypothetical protein